MNRIIKFRLVFDKKIVGYMQYMNQGEKANLNWMYSEDQKTWDFQPKYAYVEVNQFTGLTDKNGKEIYEGDIFNCIYDFDGCKKHKQAVVYVEVSARFITKDYGECHQPNVMQNMSDMIRMEVIGN